MTTALTEIGVKKTPISEPDLKRWSFTDKQIRALPNPAKGSRIVYARDNNPPGFGLRLTAAGTRSFVLNYTTLDGRERRKTIGAFPTWSVDAARTEAKRLRRLIDAGKDPLAEDQERRAAVTVDQLIDRFLEEHVSRKRPSTQVEYQRVIKREIRKPPFTRMKVADVKFADIDRMHRELTARGVLVSANKVVLILSKMFSLAIKWGYRTDNPCKGVEFNTEHGRERYLDADELSRLSAALDRLRDQQSADIIRLLLLTGARIGETLVAKWADFDLDSTTWSKPASSTKQNRRHRIPLSPPAADLLRGMRAKATPKAVYIFPSPRDPSKPLSTIHRPWVAALKDARITDFRVHDLRHTYASVLVSSGLSLPIIGALLGHSQPQTTARYAHIALDPMRHATAVAAQIISPRKPE